MDLRYLIYAGIIVIGIFLAMFFGLRVEQPSDNSGVDFYEATQESPVLNPSQALESKEMQVVNTDTEKSNPKPSNLETKNDSTRSSDPMLEIPKSSIVSTIQDRFNQSQINDFVNQALQLSSAGQLTEARDILLRTIGDDLFPIHYVEVYQLLGDLNERILMTPTVKDKIKNIYTVKSGDTLSDIANDHSCTVELIQKMNQIDSPMIFVDQKLRVPNGELSIQISKSFNLMILLLNDQYFKFYRVGTGKNNSTPVGDFKIKNKQEEPVWFHDGKIIPYGDPENLLGTRWLGFDIKGYGIHGTWDPSSIGTQSSEGCIRLENSQVEQLYEYLPLNTKIKIMD